MRSAPYIPIEERQSAVLHLLQSVGQQTAEQIAVHLEVSRTRAIVILAPLVARGWITKVFQRKLAPSGGRPEAVYSISITHLTAELSQELKRKQQELLEQQGRVLHDCFGVVLRSGVADLAAIVEATQLDRGRVRVTMKRLLESGLVREVKGQGTAQRGRPGTMYAFAALASESDGDGE